MLLAGSFTAPGPKAGHARRSLPSFRRIPPSSRVSVRRPLVPHTANMWQTEGTHMASIRKHIQIDAPPDRVWDALRDVGALHTRLVPGFVTDTRMEENARVVTFGNGMVAREEIVSVDEAQRRVCWAVLDAPFQHYNGAAWVEPDINGGS